MPDVDDFMLLTVLELMRRSEKFVVQRDNGKWKLVATWKDGQLDDGYPHEADSSMLTTSERI